MIDPATVAERLELFSGEANEAEARVYARLPADGPLDGWELSGRLIGPECRFSQTLSATIRLSDRGPGAGLLAEAVVPDPCFWTPELPMMYRAIVDVRKTNAEPCTATAERWFGIRRLGTLGRSLYFDGKRWVPRGAYCERATAADLSSARATGTVLRVPSPDDALCLEASRLGVPLLADVRGDAADVAREVRRLGKWPAVFAVVLDPKEMLDKEIRAASRNLLFAACVTSGEAIAIPAWVQLIVWHVDRAPASAIPTGQRQLPIIAVRPLRESAGMAESRAACDRLQYDLAPQGDFAGYFV
jgi:hypothetical protein